MVQELRLREWQTLGPKDTTILRGLQLDTATSRLAEQLSQQGVLEITELRGGIEVRSFAHVGRVRLGALVITVEPKLGPGELLALVRYAYGLRHLRLFDSVTFGTSEHLLQDLLVAQLYAEVRELVERGLVKRYVATTEQLASPRGRIDINMLAAAAGNSMSATLPCRHHPRSQEHLLTRVLNAGLRLAGGIAQDTRLKRSTFRLADVLAVYASAVALNANVLDRARRSLNRLVAAYEPALRLVELLYESTSASLNGEAGIKLPGFFFNMNSFFQALVARLLRDHLPGYKLLEEHSLSGTMRYAPGKNPRQRRAPCPRPDFLVQGRDGETKVLDAKYRDLWETALPRDMLYQLSVYALSQPKGSVAAIVYPTMDTNASEAVIELREPVLGVPRAYVMLRPLLLPRLVSALRRERTEEGMRIARELAFG